ncbi:MAG TPA: phosphatidylglycerophosphatase A [Planctomycetaceae bacterium]|nr:phosphatidylglycerophosphatase A [Planctomycetaceae bacterium]
MDDASTASGERPLPQSIGDRLVVLLATGLGVGWIPRAPGTFGSLLGLPLAWGIAHLPFAGQIAAAVVVFLIGLGLCDRAAKVLKAKDPGAIVFDEIAAFPVIYLFAPISVFTAVAGFLLFRLFDITKPWPAGRFEKLPGGLGIMADDLIAGIYSGAALWCLVSLWPAV